MKKLALFAALLGLTTSAQTTASEILPLAGSCKTLVDTKKFIEEEYHEYPFAGGPSVVRMADGKWLDGIGKIYVDPKDKGFTFVIEFAEIDRSCVLLMGDDFAPLTPGNTS